MLSDIDPLDFLNKLPCSYDSCKYDVVRDVWSIDKVKSAIKIIESYGFILHPIPITTKNTMLAAHSNM